MGGAAARRIRPRHGLAVWAALWRVRASHELHYRANFVLNLFQVLIDLAIGVITIRLVFVNVDTLNGWSQAELLVVLGTYTVLDALVRAVILPNMFAIVSDVRDGNFDTVLAMPVDEQLVASTRELSVWDLSGVLIGIGVTAYGARDLDVDAVHVLGYAAFVVAGATIVYGFFLMVTSLAFRMVDLGELLFRIFQASSYSGRWPLAVYPAWLRVALTAVVPTALAVTIPSATLSGRMSGAWLAASIAATLGTAAVSRWVFRRAIRSYSGASA